MRGSKLFREYTCAIKNLYFGKPQNDVKTYYLPGYRSVGIGVILIAMGIGMFFIGFDRASTAWDNFQNMVLDFSGIGHFLVSLLLLLFKALFITLGYFSLRYQGKVARARLDAKGIYFKELKGGNNAERLAFDLGGMTFVPYREITDIRYVENAFSGNYLQLETTQGIRDLKALGVLGRAEREEIYDIVQARIARRKDKAKKRS